MLLLLLQRRWRRRHVGGFCVHVWPLPHSPAADVCAAFFLPTAAAQLGLAYMALAGAGPLPLTVAF